MIRPTIIATLLGMSIAGAASAQQIVGGCSVFPANNVWNTPVNTLPVRSDSTTLVNTIGPSRGFHADFGSGTWNGGPIGIPFITVPGSQTKYPATFDYAGESDPGPYAVPLNAPIEGGAGSTGDRHAIAIDTTNCILYELFAAYPGSSSWTAGSGAIYDLKSNALRPAGWTSADAAGLPILPGLVSYDEVASGEIRHAIRFTTPQTRAEYVWPARHKASSLTGAQYPRMGERFRLKAGFDISPYPSEVQVILRAMKTYGIILADNGSAWFISGVPDSRWNNDNLARFGSLLGSNFEAVDVSSLIVDPNSGATTVSSTPTPTPSTPTVLNPTLTNPPTAPATPTLAKPGDFDGDRSADRAVYRPSNSSWMLQLSNGTSPSYVWGQSGDTPVPGDYDGDGRLDLAVYRPSTGKWYICWSSTNFATYSLLSWGSSDFVPVPADYDGDGRTDPAVYRPSDGTWWLLRSSSAYHYTGLPDFRWGGGDFVPIPADYDGDGKADPAVYRAANGSWWLLKSGNAYRYTGLPDYTWGGPGYVPVPADYDGDGKADPTVFQAGNASWWLRKSSNSYRYTGLPDYAWGAPGDVAVPGDFDGDGKADAAVYRPSTGAWLILKSSNGSNSTYALGSSGDTPLHP